MPERCVCGRPAPEAPARALPSSPVEAEVRARLEAIRARRLAMAEELGRLVREEQELRARLTRLAHEN